MAAIAAVAAIAAAAAMGIAIAASQGRQQESQRPFIVAAMAHGQAASMPGMDDSQAANMPAAAAAACHPQLPAKQLLARWQAPQQAWHCDGGCHRRCPLQHDAGGRAKDSRLHLQCCGVPVVACRVADDVVQINGQIGDSSGSSSSNCMWLMHSLCQHPMLPQLLPHDTRGSERRQGLTKHRTCTKI